MAVTFNTLWRVKPGGMAETMGNVSAAKPILERHGGVVRAVAPMAGGEPGTIRVTVTCADWAAYGAYAGGLAADPDWLAFQMNILGRPDPSATLISTSLWTDLPI